MVKKKSMQFIYETPKKLVFKTAILCASLHRQLLLWPIIIIVIEGFILWFFGAFSCSRQIWLPIILKETIKFVSMKNIVKHEKKSSKLIFWFRAFKFPITFFNPIRIEVWKILHQNFETLKRPSRLINFSLIFHFSLLHVYFFPLSCIIILCSFRFSFTHSFSFACRPMLIFRKIISQSTLW